MPRRYTLKVAVEECVWKSLGEVRRAPIDNLMTVEANHLQIGLWNGGVKAETQGSVVVQEWY